MKNKQVSLAFMTRKSGHMLRLPDALGLMVLLQLVFLSVGQVTSAQAQQMVVCSNGEAAVTTTRYIKIDTDAGTCTTSVAKPADPANGVQITLGVTTNYLRFIGNLYENGAITGGQASGLWSITNYTGSIMGAANAVAYQSTVPSSGASSEVTSTFTINGQAIQFSASGITKTNGVASVTFGQIAIVFAPPAPPSTGPTASDKSKTDSNEPNEDDNKSRTSSEKSNVAGYLLSSFNLIGSGVPEAVINGRGTADGAGFTFVPNSSMASAPGASVSAFSFGSNVDTANPMDRDNGFAQRGYGLSTLSDPSSAQSSGNGFNFSIDMQRLLADRRKHEELGAGGGFNDDAYQPRSRWNAWAMGRYTDFDDRNRNADRDGYLWSLTSGLSFALFEHTTIGAFTRLREGETDSTALDTSLDSDFFGGGVFLVTTLDNGVRLMGAGLIESGDNEIVISGDRGSFDSEQTTVEARIDRRFTRGQHWVEPAVKILYTDLDRDGFADTSGAVIGSGGSTLGRLTFGPIIGTTIQHRRATLKPFARLNGVWDFENEDPFALSTGAVVSTDDMAINLGWGLEVAFGNGVVAMAAGDWLSFNDDLNAISVTGSIGMPLSVLRTGAASNGFVSLDFSTNQEDTSAKARLRIQLGANAD